jgi:hypothetical protein
MGRGVRSFFARLLVPEVGDKHCLCAGDRRKQDVSRSGKLCICADPGGISGSEVPYPGRNGQRGPSDAPYTVALGDIHVVRCGDSRFRNSK